MSKQKNTKVTLIKATKPSTVLKAEHSQALEDDPFQSQYSIDGIIQPPYPIVELSKMIEYSTILQQCVDAYKRNIVGFGYALKYNVDENEVDETPEMKSEWKKVTEWVKYFNFDKSFEDVFAQAIEHREKTGNGYIEILRDGKGLAVGGDNVDPDFMRVTKLTDAVEVTYKRDGKSFKRSRKFRRYVQDLGTKKVFFKQFGDPRFMNSRTGDFTAQHNGEEEASEILHLKIGDKAYGIPRWIGHLIHMYGARKAEELNYRYFTQGRHNPAAIIVSNGLLTDESVAKLEEYANTVEGVENSHKFLIIEAEGLEQGIIPGEEREGVKVELKPLAEMLQQDALFLEYDEASREKVQSSFRLPDLYVGRSKDFNRATADTAKQVTEEQVFEPERNSLEFVINNSLLIEQELSNVVLYFKAPEISDIDEKTKLLDVLGKYGGITPNDLRDEVAKVLGKELEVFDHEDADLPIVLTTLLKQQTAQTPAETAQIASQIEKAELEGVSMQKQFVSILREVRDVLEDIQDEQK
jgi:PBSX family phage portal protein